MITISALWDILTWLYNYWLLIIWGASVVLAYVYGGKKLAFIVMTLGLGAIAYHHGRQTERKINKTQILTEEERFRHAYEEIDNRDTNRDDVIERLRKATY